MPNNINKVKKKIFNAIEYISIINDTPPKIEGYTNKRSLFEPLHICSSQNTHVQDFNKNHTIIYLRACAHMKEETGVNALFEHIK